MEQLRVLLLEDIENDMELIKTELIQSMKYDFIFEWTDNRADYIDALNNFHPDIILSDYNLPQFNGLEAVKIALEISPLTPFLIVTGTLTEEVAAESIINGSWDYVVKERLHRLPRAIENALKLKREKEKTARAEEDLEVIKAQSGIQIKLLFNAISHAPSSVRITDADGTILYVNPKFTEVTGYRLDEAVGNTPRLIKSGEQSDDFYKDLWSTILKGKEWKGEIVNKKKNGELYWEQVSISSILDAGNNIVNFVANGNDISGIKETENKLRTSENWYRALFGNTGTATCIFDSDGTISLANPKCLDLSGYTKEEIEGKKKWFEFIAVSDVDKMKNYFLERKQGKEAPETYEFIFIDKWNNSKNVLLSIKSIQGTDKFIASLLDITYRKRIEATLETERILLKTVIENLPDAIYVKDTNLRKILVNKADLNNFGRTEEEVLGKTDYELLPPEIAEKTYKDDEYVVNTGKPLLDREEFVSNFEGVGRWLLTSKLPLYNKEGMITGLVGIGRDISENKKMIEELVKAKDKAEEMNRLKSIFLANMSHELRTPLVGLLGFSEVLYNELTGEMKEYADMISVSGERLLRTLSALLDYSKIEAEKINSYKTSFSLTNLINEEIKLYSGISRNKGINIFTEFQIDSLDLFSDERLIREILDNLLNNALKFTKKGHISIKLHKENAMAVIKIEDTGIGIAKENMDLIFEEFRQVSEGDNRSYQGSGLGLTLVKRYVSLLGGTIEVESQVNSGSTFTIRIPIGITETGQTGLKDGSKESGQPVKVESPDKTSKRILLVEDDKISELAIRKMLDRNYYVDSANNAVNAIKAANTIVYDAILMDINLGEGMNGIEAASEIRKTKQHDNVPIIAITAYATDKERDDFLNSGCSHYIAKPFKKQVILDLLNTIFETKKTR